jgi:hypothetical protein
MSCKAFKELVPLLLGGLILPLAATIPAAPSESARPGSIAGTHHRQMALAAELPPDQVKWLDVRYPGLEQTVQVLALELLPHTAQAQGAVLILHAPGQHPDWPTLVSPLRRVLPEDGWHTLSIGMPAPDAPQIPARELATKVSESVLLNEQIARAVQEGARASAPASVPESAPAPPPVAAAPAEAVPVPEPAAQTEAPVKVDIDLQDRIAEAERQLSYGDRAVAHIGAGIEHLRQAGFRNIVVLVVGRSAEAVLDWLKPDVQQYSQKGFALVLLAPEFAYTGQRFWQDRLGAPLQAPILDLVDSADLAARAAAGSRQVSADVLAMTAYQQQSWRVPDAVGDDRGLIRRLRQWLKINAPGMSASRAPARPQ